jgi:hypothetical protein
LKVSAKPRNMDFIILVMRGQKRIDEVSGSLLARLVWKECAKQVGKNCTQSTENLSVKGC